LRLFRPIINRDIWIIFIFYGKICFIHAYWATELCRWQLYSDELAVTNR